MDPLPGVKSAFSLVSREESNQKHNTHSNSVTNKSQSSAFASRFIDQKKNNKGKGPIPQCKNCGLKGHSIEKCFKIIGYPKEYKQRSESNNSQSNQTKYYSNNLSAVQGSESNISCSDQNKSSDTHYLTGEQYSKFLKLINENQNLDDNTATANMAGISCNSTF